MPENVVRLNTDNYVIEKRRSGQYVDSDEFQPFAEARRTTGQQRQSDLVSRSSFVLPSPIYGIGRSYTPANRVDDPEELMRFYDATCDTRWPDAVYLPILEEDSTETGLEVMRAWTHFKGHIRALWEDNTSQDVVSRNFTGNVTRWDGGGTVAAFGQTGIALDIIAHKGNVIALTVQLNDHETMNSSDAASWSDATTDITAGMLSNNVTTHEDIDAGLLASIGGEAVAVLWHESNGTITFFTSTDGGDTWEDEAVDIQSDNGPQGVAVMAGIDNEEKLYVCTKEGLHEVDTAPATWTTRLIFPMVSHTDNGRRMVVGHDGALWFAQGVDDNRMPLVYRMIISNGERRIVQVPNDFSLGDSPPSDALGPIRWFYSSGGFMYAASGGGAASRNARIWCHNGLGWHSVRKHGTANEKIEAIIVSAEDDGVPRLHYAIRTATDTTDTVFLANPDVSPQSGVSIKREASGYVDRPEMQGGMPTTDGALLQYRADATDLSADTTGEYINIDYGTNGIDRTSLTNWGDIVSATTTLNLASGAGIQAISFGIRENLHRDAADNTEGPVLRSSELVYEKVTDVLEQHVFTVNILATASMWAKPPKDVVDNLKKARNSKPLAPFSYANLTTQYVRTKVKWMTEPHQTAGTSSGSDTMAQIIGYAQVEVREVI